MNNQAQINQKKIFLAIVGPTASGKTSLAIELAKKLNTEILSVDSMQVYQGLNVGTAKPSPDDLKQVKHYGIDIVSPLQNFNASEYTIFSEKILQNYAQDNKFLILCGGTGLYYRALLEGFFDVPDANPEIRNHFHEKMKQEGLHALYKQLQQLDLHTANSIHPNDARRIIRALEIMAQTQTSITELKKNQIKKPWIDKTLFVGLRWKKEKLDTRIIKRVHWMYNCGLIDETKWLIDIGCTQEHTAFQALGYRECYAYLQGEICLKEAEQLTARNTIQYAKRQMTWFRRQFQTHWIDQSTEISTEENVQQSLHILRNSGNNTDTD